MLTYSEAKDMMQRAKHGRRKLENNTWLEERHRHDGKPVARTPWPDYAVRLHSTDVVTLHPDNSYTLDSGGWRTVTTKDRINRYAPVALFSSRGAWMVVARKKKLEPWDSYGEGFSWDFDSAVPFADGIRVHADGGVTGAGIDEAAIRSQLLKQIRAYVDGFAEHVVKHGLAAPSGGDCWGCLMRPQETTKPQVPVTRGGPWRQGAVTKPGADHVMGLDHIFEHFKERYYVPSLLWRAVQRRGKPQLCYALMQADAQLGRVDMLKRDLRAYFKTLMPALVAAKVAELERAA